MPNFKINKIKHRAKNYGNLSRFLEKLAQIQRVKASKIMLLHKLQPVVVHAKKCSLPVAVNEELLLFF